MPNFKQYHQRYVVSACCALHNLIRINNCSDIMFNTWENLEIDGGSKQDGWFRDYITDSMWEDYIRHRG